LDIMFVMMNKFSPGNRDFIIKTIKKAHNGNFSCRMDTEG